MNAPRLSATTIGDLPDTVERPGYDRSALRPRMVHIGVGAFHRAHQAVYTDDANASSDGDWGVTGLSLRSDTAAHQLKPQDGLFTVAARDGSGDRYRLVANMLDVITAPERPGAALAALTSEDLSVVTLTITEKGYGLDPATGTLDTGRADIASDLANPAEPATAIGLLAHALNQRRVAGSAPLTLVSCDNLPENGRLLSAALIQYADCFSTDLARYVGNEIKCPQTMVDRIVPAATPADVQRAQAALGVRDEAHVATEPFRQWVIEDHFAGPRPNWEAGGAMIVPDVAPFETAKLRLLNGAHSAIAYLGYLAGHDYVHDVMADPSLAAFVSALMTEEIAPTIVAPLGLPLEPYAAALRDRFTNPALHHRTWQIATDGSQKLPQRLLAPIKARLATDAPFPRLALAVAAWITYASGQRPHGEPIDVRDPLSAEMASIARLAGHEPRALVEGFLGLSEVFDADIAGDDRFSEAVGHAMVRLHHAGPRGAALIP